MNLGVLYSARDMCACFAQQMFVSRKREYYQVCFAGTEIDKTEDGFIVHQGEYCGKIPLLKPTSDFQEFSSIRARLTWATHTRPDICCAVNQAAQATQSRFEEDPTTCVKDINKITKHLHSLDLPLKFSKLDPNSLQLTVYSDASFAINYDMSSQLGYIIFLSDKTRSCNLHYSSHKSKRVTRSVLGGEVMAFGDVFDTAMIIRHDLQNLLHRNVPIIILTGSLSVFGVISKSTITAERRLLIDLDASKAAYTARELQHVGFLRTQCNLADAFTKVKRCPILEVILIHGKLDHPIEQWISRGPVPS
jgi:hypothetical protein